MTMKQHLGGTRKWMYKLDSNFIRKRVKCSGKPCGVSVAKDLIPLDPLNTKLMFNSSLADGDNISKIYWTQPFSHHRTHGEENIITATRVFLAVKTLKAVDSDKIRPAMLKALSGGVHWPTCVCQRCLVFSEGIETLAKWGDHPYTQGRLEGMHQLPRHLSPQKSICQVPWKRCREIIVTKLEDTQCIFHPSRSTTNQIFTLPQIFEKPWEYAKDLNTCFIDLEEVYDRV